MPKSTNRPQPTNPPPRNTFKPYVFSYPDPDIIYSINTPERVSKFMIILNNQMKNYENIKTDFSIFVYNSFKQILGNYVEGNTQSLIYTLYNYKKFKEQIGNNDEIACNGIKDILFVNIPMDPRFSNKCPSTLKRFVWPSPYQHLTIKD
jgi:hypothetical protein